MPYQPSKFHVYPFLIDDVRATVEDNPLPAHVNKPGTLRTACPQRNSQNEHVGVTALQDSEDEMLEDPSGIESRIHEYHARVNDEGEMSDTEALEVEKLLFEQETEDDKFWKVCTYCMQNTRHGLKVQLLSPREHDSV